jgi:hypothetical protein
MRRTERCPKTRRALGRALRLLLLLALRQLALPLASLGGRLGIVLLDDVVPGVAVGLIGEPVEGKRQKLKFQTRRDISLIACLSPNFSGLNAYAHLSLPYYRGCYVALERGCYRCPAADPSARVAFGTGNSSTARTFVSPDGMARIRFGHEPAWSFHGERFMNKAGEQVTYRARAMRSERWTRPWRWWRIAWVPTDGIAADAQSRGGPESAPLVGATLPPR